jgi:hypothetical protein
VSELRIGLFIHDVDDSPTGILRVDYCKQRGSCMISQTLCASYARDDFLEGWPFVI